MNPGNRVKKQGPEKKVINGAGWERASSQLASDIRHLMFEGQYNELKGRIREYLEVWSDHDPHARAVMKKIIDTSFGMLSFRSFSTDMSVLKKERQNRVRVWNEILPFDCQLMLAQDEWGLDRLEAFEVKALNWTTWHEFLDAKDPDSYFKNSSLGAWTSNGPGPASTVASPKKDPMTGEVVKPMDWQEMQSRCAVMIAHHAGLLIMKEDWMGLDEWMTAGRIDPWQAMTSLYIHYRFKSGHGAVWVSLDQPRPFWSLGVFNGACDPAYWDVMKKHGGPSAPLFDAKNPDGHRPGVAKTPVPLASSLSDWSDPLSWLKVDGILMRDVEREESIRAQVQRALSSWKKQSLSALSQSSSEAVRQAKVRI